MFIPTYLIWDFFKKNESKHLLFLWIVDENGAKILILTKRVFQLRPRKAIQEYIKWFNSKYIQLKPKCCLTAPSIQFGILLRRLSPSVPSEASMLSCLSLLIRWRPKFCIPSTTNLKPTWYTEQKKKSSWPVTGLRNRVLLKNLNGSK